MAPWRLQVLSVAESWLLTPWHHRACVKGAGVDCGNLLKACYVEAGLVEDFSLGIYPPDWMLHRSEERFLGFVGLYCERVDTPQPADIAVWRHGRCFSHGAIVVEWPRVIHAYYREGQVCWGDGLKGWLAEREVRFYQFAQPRV